MKRLLIFTAFLFLLLAVVGNANAAPEPGCPGGTGTTIYAYCDNFDNLDPEWLDSNCCYHSGPGVNNALPGGNGVQRGTADRDPRAKPGGVDPGPCPIPPGNDCGLSPTTFQGNQGFSSQNSWWSGYYWESGGNYYGNSSLPANYTELRFRWYAYLNDGWNIPCHPGIPVVVSNNCGAKMFLLDGGGGIPKSLGYVMIYTAANGVDGQSQLELYGNPDGGPVNLEAVKQNQGNTLTLHKNQWYLYEWHVKMNTGTNHDGTSELWIDEATPGVTQGPQTLRERHTNLRFSCCINDGDPYQTSWRRIGLSPNSNYGYCHPGMVINDGANSNPACHETNGVVDTTHPNAYLKISNIVVSTGSNMIGPVGVTGGTTPQFIPNPPAALTPHQ